MGKQLVKFNGEAKKEPPLPHGYAPDKALDKYFKLDDLVVKVIYIYPGVTVRIQALVPSPEIEEADVLFSRLRVHKLTADERKAVKRSCTSLT